MREGQGVKEWCTAVEAGGRGFPSDGAYNIVWQCRNERRFPER